MDKKDVMTRIEELNRIAKEARDARFKTTIAAEEGREYLNSLMIDDYEFLVGTGLGQELLVAVYAAENAGTRSMDKETMQQ